MNRRKKRRRQVIRNRILLTVFVLMLIFVCTALCRCALNSCNSNANAGSASKAEDEITIYPLSVQNEAVSVTSLYIYGNHLNIEGILPTSIYDHVNEYTSTDTLDVKVLSTFTLDKDSLNSVADEAEAFMSQVTGLYISIYNTQTFEVVQVPLNCDGETFYFNELYNGGLYLDNIERGYYLLYLSVVAADNMYYFALDNLTGYQETEYYTLSTYGNVITINSRDINESELDGNESDTNVYTTLCMNVTKCTDDNVYDIVIDPGHGGEDYGATPSRDLREADMNLSLALKTFDYLEEAGYKVYLTRTEDVDVNTYGEGGRIAVCGDVKAKVVFSLHMNSAEGVRGLEIYASENTKIDMIKAIRDNIISYTDMIVSTKDSNTENEGIFTKNFTEEDIIESMLEYEEDGLIPFDITTDSAYYYIIRETGGIVTGAFMDVRNGADHYNPYYNSNVGIESYIIETGYITNSYDAEILKYQADSYAKAISDGVIQWLN